MPLKRQFLFFTAIFFLLCPILSIAITFMDLGYNGFQFIYANLGNYTLIIPPVGFFLLCFLIRSYAPQSDGSGYFDVIDLIENKSINKKTIAGLRVPAISYRDFIARLILTPVSAFFGGSVGQAGPELHMASAFSMLFEKKIKLAKEILIYSACICCLTLLFNALLAGFIFALESTIRIHIKESKDQNNTSNAKKMNWIDDFLSKLPFLILAGLISIFWLKITGKWNYSLSSIGLSFGFISSIDWFNYLKVLLAAIAMTVTFQVIYAKCFQLMTTHWKILSLFWGCVLSTLIFLFGSGVSGSGLDFLNINHSFEIEYWQKWLANLATLSSGISSGLISTSIGIGALLSAAYLIPASVGISSFLAIILNRPLTGAFLVSELINLPLVPCLFGAICSALFFTSVLQLFQRLKVICTG